MRCLVSSSNILTLVDNITLAREFRSLDKVLKDIYNGENIFGFPCDLIRKFYDFGYSWTIEDDEYLVYKDYHTSRKVKLNYWLFNRSPDQCESIIGSDFIVNYESKILSITHNGLRVSLFFHDDSGLYVFRGLCSFYVEYQSSSGLNELSIKIEFKEDGAEVDCDGNRNDLFHFLVTKAD